LKQQYPCRRSDEVNLHVSLLRVSLLCTARSQIDVSLLVFQDLPTIQDVLTPEVIQSSPKLAAKFASVASTFSSSERDDSCRDSSQPKTLSIGHMQFELIGAPDSTLPRREFSSLSRLH